MEGETGHVEMGEKNLDGGRLGRHRRAGRHAARKLRRARPDSGKNPAYASTQAAAAGNGQAPAPKSSNRFKVEEKEPEQVEAKEDGPQTPEQILSPETGKPTVDVLADKTAGLLQNLSQKGIRLVVSVFDSITE